LELFSSRMGGKEILFSDCSVDYSKEGVFLWALLVGTFQIGDSLFPFFLSGEEISVGNKNFTLF